MHTIGHTTALDKEAPKPDKRSGLNAQYPVLQSAPRNGLGGRDILVVKEVPPLGHGFRYDASKCRRSEIHQNRARTSQSSAGVVTAYSYTTDMVHTYVAAVVGKRG